MNLPPDFKEFLRLLADHCVEYVIVGGYAVARHGYPRFTGDLDVLIYPSAENACRLLAAIEEFGFGSLGLEVNDFTELGRVVQLGMPPLRIDLLTSLDGVSTDEIFSDKVSDRDEELTLHFISRDNLVANKKATNRPQDVADLDNL